MFWSRITLRTSLGLAGGTLSLLSLACGGGNDNAVATSVTVTSASPTPTATTLTNPASIAPTPTAVVQVQAAIPTPVPQAQAAPSPTPQPPSGQAGPAPNPIPAVRGSDKLSGRLQQIVALADQGRLPASAQQLGPLLGLPGSGAGSLSYTQDGKLVVDARLSDTSAAVQAALMAHGAIVIASTPSSPTVTLGVDPARLKELLDVPAVQYVEEALRPGTNARPG